MQQEEVPPRLAMPPFLHAGNPGQSDLFDDAALSTWLDERRSAGEVVGYLHGDHVCKVVRLKVGDGQLLPASPEQQAKRALKELFRKGLLEHLELPQADLHDAHFLDTTWTFQPVRSTHEISSLVDDRLTMMGLAGRGQDISTRTAQKVWAEAGGRCMFEGCGDDLTEIPLHREAARVGYLAHIVATDPRGPRGSRTHSHALSDEPSNIMLMCDKHHRLIDVIALDDYSEERLRAMRQSHQNRVQRCMDALKFPRSKAVTLHANLAGIPTHFPDSAFLEPLHESRLSMGGRVDYIRRTTLRDERSALGFWSNYLREHENQIRVMVHDFNNAIAADEALAVFPIHHVATLVLAGRIMGEARPIEVFQYHRQRGTWAWDKNAQPHPPGTFQLVGLTQGRTDEALISLELTARLDEAALPPRLAQSIQEGQMPWVRLTTPKPSPTCIAHPQDLDQFARLAREAINHVQDVMRATRVHLIAVSPASAVFRFGQMLQSGHHPLYVVYDRSDRDQPFVPALTISGLDVSATDGHRPVHIPLR